MFCQGSLKRHPRETCGNKPLSGFHTCKRHAEQEERIIAQKAAEAVAAVERAAYEEKYKATGLQIVLCDGVSAPQDDESEQKRVFDVDEIYGPVWLTAAVLYGYCSYDETKKKRVLYYGLSPADAERTAKEVENSNWYRAALYPPYCQEG